MAREGCAVARRLTPVILAGGAGTRLWPLSRPARPKPFLALAGDRTLLQETVLRVTDAARFASPIIVANAQDADLVRDQLAEIGVEPAAILLEPSGRNTAPAVTLAALHAAAAGSGAVLAVLPSDHAVEDAAGFRAALARAAEAAAGGTLVALGVSPQRPEPGYGYICPGTALPGLTDVRAITSFVEKPAPATATHYVEDGQHLWNSGVFVMPADLLLTELERFEPTLVATCREAITRAERDGWFLRIDAAEFAAAPALSIDVAVMERTNRGAVLPIDVGWRDLGSFTALHEAAEADGEGNVVRGDAVLPDSHGCYVHAADGVLVAGIGLDDMIVVVTGDAVLIVPKSRAGEVENLIARLGNGRLGDRWLS